MGLNIKAIEKHYGVRYVGFYDIPGKDHVYVFWHDNPNRDLGHSNYLGAFVVGPPEAQTLYVTNAMRIEEAEYNAIEINGRFICSRYRHDYQTEGEAMIDGGLDYARYNPNFPVTHTMIVRNGYEQFVPRS